MTHFWERWPGRHFIQFAGASKVCSHDMDVQELIRKIDQCDMQMVVEIADGFLERIAPYVHVKQVNANLQPDWDRALIYITVGPTSITSEATEHLLIRTDASLQVSYFDSCDPNKVFEPTDPEWLDKAVQVWPSYMYVAQDLPRPPWLRQA